MKIPEAALHQNIAVLGKNGSGKTYAAKAVIVEPLLAEGRRVGIVDPTGAWWGLRTSRDGKGAGFKILVLGGDHCDLPLPANGGAAVARLLAEQGVSLVADTSQFTVGERTRWFTDFAGTLYRTNKAPLHLILDEAHNFAPQGKVPDPDAGKMLHAASTLASQGRSRGIRLTMITQRPQKLHKDSLTSAETLIAMRVIHPLDRGAVADWINGCADPVKGKEVLDSLAGLKTGEGWVWHPGEEFLHRMKFPAIKTFDSSATPMEGAAAAAPKGAAEIDLTEIRAALADAVKEAEANDPKILRARIAQLEREARKPTASTAPRAAAPDARPLEKRAAALRNALETAMKFIATIKTVGFPDKVDSKKLEAAIAAAVERVGAQINAEFDGHRRAFARWQADGDKVLANLQRLLGDESVPIAVTVRHNEPFTVAAPRATPQPRAAAPREPREGGMERAHRAFLIALAQQARELTRNQVAIFAGYSATSRHVDNTLAALRSQGFVVGGRDAIAITPEGLAALGPYDPLPVGEALRDYWMRELDKAAAEFLRVICEAHPQSLTRDEIAERAGYSPTSRHVDNTLAQLRSRDLVSGGRAAISASPDLF